MAQRRSSRFMVVDYPVSGAALFPTNGQGGNSSSSSSSCVLSAQKVIITGISVITLGAADRTLTITNADGTVDILPFQVRINSAADRHTPPNWDLELDRGFGVKCDAADATLKVLISFIQVN